MENILRPQFADTWSKKLVIWFLINGNKIKRDEQSFWTEKREIFYLDRASFTHKMNHFDQVRAPRAMVWRIPGQGLDFCCTAKGSHEGTGRSVAHVMTAIAYGKEVIAAEQYFGSINGATFSPFVYEHFASMFKKCPNLKGKLFLQDGDPSQNSCKARSAWGKIGAGKFSIPAHSPDLNPIENIFHIVKKRLHQDTLEMKIEREDFMEFSAQVKNTLEIVPVDVVDRTIQSMDKQIDLIVKKNRE